LSGKEQGVGATIAIDMVIRIAERVIMNGGAYRVAKRTTTSG